MLNKKTIKTLLSLFILAIVFISISYFVQNNTDNLKLLILNLPLFWAEVFYVLIGILTTVIAPLSSLPLVPIASGIFGWKVTAILNLVGWSLGSLIAFLIASKYGKPFIRKFISLEKLEKVEKKIPKDNLFWSVVFMRIIIPVDILSYALGIFTKMKVKNYMLATILGTTPFAFILAYLGEVTIQNQIIILTIFFSIFSLWLLFKK